MKKLLLCTLLLIGVTTPALANNAEKHTPSGEMIVAHTGMRQVRIQELFKTGAMSVSLMKLSHQQMNVALEKKDHSEVEKALETFQTAYELQKDSMQTLQKMSTHMGEHLKAIQAGTLKMTPAQTGAFEKEVALFTQRVEAFHTDCHDNVRPQNQAMRNNALNFLMLDFAEAQKSEQADKMVHIAHIMKLLPPFKPR